MRLVVAVLLFSTAFSLLRAQVGSPFVSEEPLNCYQSLSTCESGVNVANEAYSQCCEESGAAFSINGTCYTCEELVHFSETAYTVLEDGGVVSFEVQRTVNPGTDFFLFSVVITDGSAKAGIDYGPFPDSGVELLFIMLPGDTSVVSGVVIIDDDVVEYSENFTISLIALSKDRTPLGSTRSTAQVTITDNDKVDINVNPQFAVLQEPSHSLSFTVNKTGESVRDVSVLLDVSGPELELTQPAQQMLTFAPQETMKLVEISVPDDDIVEATEEHRVLLRIPESETGVNLIQDDFTVSVEDNDFVNVSLVGGIKMSRMESNVTVTVEKNGRNERSVFVKVFTEDTGSAEGGLDYRPVDMVLEFPPSQNVTDTANIEVLVIRDGLIEDTEELTLNIEVVSTETGVRIQQSSMIILIEDYEVLRVVSEVTSVSVREGMQATVRWSVVQGTLARNATIGFQITPDDADVQLLNPTITFDPDTYEQTLTLTAVNDDIYEGLESVELTVTSLPTRTETVPRQLTVLIEDDDSPQLSFTQSIYNVSEDAGSVVVTILFDAPTETSHMWTLVTVDNTTTENDYTPLNESLVFSNSIRQANVTVRITNDTFSEGLETFMLELGNEREILASSIVQIEDDEKLQISFVQPNYTRTEGDGLFGLQINKSGATFTDIAVNILLEDISAQGGKDYGVFPTSRFEAAVVILAEESDLFFALPIMDDNIVEYQESFKACILPSDSDFIILGDINETVVYIEDNDKVNVSLSVRGSGVVSEEQGDGEVVFNISRDTSVDLDRPVSVTFSTADITATASRDYTTEATNQQFTFTQTGPSFFETNVTILDDSVVEGVESFSANLSSDSPINLLSDAAIIYITDEDKIQVDFSDIDYTVTEDEVVTLFLNKSGTNEIPVTVSVETMTFDDTATAELDYEPSVQPLEFSSSDVRLPLSIPVVDDSVLEDRERFTVQLIVTANDSNVVLGPRDTAEVYILDNDNVTVELSDTEYEVEEGRRSVTIGVLLLGDTDINVAVQISTADGTADASDYTPLLQNLTFSPTESSQTVEILIADDSFCESEREEFTVGLASSDERVLLSELRRSTVAILEDDRCGMGFERERYNVTEPESGQLELSVCIERRGSTNEETNIVVIAEEILNSPVEQQAVDDADFRFSANVLSISPEDLRVCLNVSILSDSREEQTELFKMRILADPQLEVFQSETIIAISDFTEEIITDVVVEFTSTIYSESESAGQTVINITASRPSQEIIAVYFSTEDNSATSPQDFSSQTNTLVTFAPGETQRSVSVSITSDNLLEGQESFFVHLSLPPLSTGVELGTQSSATVFIIDGGVFVNDTVLGDPLFIVPLYMTNDSYQFQQQPSLCYEVHGQSEWYFNLVSDQCTSVNALYDSAGDLNVITEIGVQTLNSRGECVTVKASVQNNCDPEITVAGSEEQLTSMRYSDADITVRQVGFRVRVSVPNCASSQLVMYITCKDTDGVQQMRFDIMRGFNLQPSSHGLLGQFWNIPIRVTPFEYQGPIVYDLQEQELYRIEVNPVDSVSREFVAEYYDYPWDLTRNHPCLYAGDQQGGPLREIRDPNDPVIEGSYEVYRTKSLFDSDFQFSKFTTAQCN